MKGVLDRVEDGVAVILVEDKQDEFTVSAKDLPTGSKEGTWFHLTYDGASYTILNIDKEKTASSKKQISSLAQKLQVRKKQSKFKRS